MRAQPSIRASIIEARTYLRPLDEQGTIFETPEQATERVIGHQRWLWERAQKAPLREEQEYELAELKELMLDRKVALSGRTRWLGGTEVTKKIEATNFNPGRRSTKFITDKGVRSFEDFEDGDTVVALTHTGAWKSARVMMAGYQPINAIRFKRGRTEHVEHFTPTHTWLLEDGTRTTALAPGDQIMLPPAQEWTFDAAPVDEQMWWCYGFIYGDDTLTNNGGGSMVRLCGAKADYLSRFTSCGFSHSFPPSCGADPIVYTGKYTKTLPTSADEQRMVRAFVHGYVAADGARNGNYSRDQRNEFRSIQATGADTCEFIERFFPAAGFYIHRYDDISGATNFGDRSALTRRYSFTQDFGNRKFSVAEITALPPEFVWCLTVEDDHSFVLPNGIVTGNCSFLEVRTVHDIVDAYWLLLQGCGVGFRPVVGTLNGFSNPMEVEVIRSKRAPHEKGREYNIETIEDGVWTLQIGDSSAAWAKSAGKLLAGKNNARKLVLDFSQVRGKGARLSSYGWISSGDEQIAPAYEAIAKIMSARAGELLTRIDILDIVNWFGYTLSSRRAAEIALVAFGEPEWEAFAAAKKDHWTTGNIQRSQSNNSLMFYSRPTKYHLRRIFKMMQENGGSEPGFINAEQALKRAAYFRGINPCAEILLGDRGFCNLVETVLPRFNGDTEDALMRAHYLAARANYRQTCVDLRDGVLQDGWHQVNEFLRLCGVGVTGAVAWEHVDEDQAWADLRQVATLGADDMAEELGLPRAKNVTTIKPSGTQSKCAGVVGMEIPEGLHKPPGRFIFNLVRFGLTDPLVAKLAAANYEVIQDPYNPTDVLISLPVEFSHVVFDKVQIGDDLVEVNLEPAVAQLERYKRVMTHYVDHNASVTIYYDLNEVPDIIDWLMENWDHYVGVSFLYRTDPSKTAADLGYPYLPQSVVSERTYREYVAQLLSLNSVEAGMDMIVDAECAGGACPIR